MHERDVLCNRTYWHVIIWDPKILANLSVGILDWTHHFCLEITNVFTEINEECTGGTHDFLFGTHQNLILQGSLWSTSCQLLLQIWIIQVLPSIRLVSFKHAIFITRKVLKYRFDFVRTVGLNLTLHTLYLSGNYCMCKTIQRWFYIFILIKMVYSPRDQHQSSGQDW